MRSSIGPVLLMVIGAFVVVAISFFATMQIIDAWLTPEDPNASVIHVVGATYGPACKDFVPPSGQPNLVKVGNATTALTSGCENAKGTCVFTVDAAQIGDPANGCGKDFMANWRCGSDQSVHKFYLPAEASGKSVVLSCPPP
jgi:hypothetical protein